jgi:hypothetical protein
MRLLLNAEATSVVVVLVAPVDAAFDAANDAVFPYILHFIPDDLFRTHY